MKTSFSLLALLFSIYTQGAFAADVAAPLPPQVAPLPSAYPQPALARIVGYVNYTECRPIADQPHVFVNTEVSDDEGKFYVAPALCASLENTLRCNGRRFGLVADVTTTPDLVFTKRNIVGVIQIGDSTTNPACLAAPLAPPRHRRPLTY